MWVELEDAGGAAPLVGAEGLFGVRSLDDAFDHLIRYGGRWTDENTKAYWGLTTPSVLRRQVLEAPAAAWIS